MEDNSEGSRFRERSRHIDDFPDVASAYLFCRWISFIHSPPFLSLSLSLCLWRVKSLVVVCWLSLWSLKHCEYILSYQRDLEIQSCAKVSFDTSNTYIYMWNKSYLCWLLFSLPFTFPCTNTILLTPRRHALIEWSANYIYLYIAY